MRRGEYLTEKQWKAISPHLPELESRGRPWRNDRECLEGILWVLRTGARWQDLPSQYPSPATCWRRMRRWTEQDVWLTIWRAILGQLNRRQRLDFEEAFIDGGFASAKKAEFPAVAS
jgi:transposase